MPSEPAHAPSARTLEGLIPAPRCGVQRAETGGCR